MRHRPLIGNADIDARLVAFGRDRLQPALGAAGQLDGRPPARQIDHPHVAPPYAAAQTRSQSLGAGLLGGKALGVGFDPVTPLFGLGALDRRENAVEKSLAMALDHLGDAASVGDVGADAENHDADPLRTLPRSIADRMERTAASRPEKIASPIRK